MNQSYSKKKKIAQTMILAGALASTTELLLHFNAPRVEASTVASKENFINRIAASAKPVADANGLYPSIMIAQAILESNWGTSQLANAPYYNLFGIQGSYQGKSVIFPTHEYINGKLTLKNLAFRVYPSLSASFSDNAFILKTTNFGNGPFYAGVWRANTTNYQQATAALTGKYATDPNYGASLNRIISLYDLTRFDYTSGNIASSKGSSTTATYTVKAGDSLWAISQKYSISIAQIKSWNQLKTDLIHIGQVLQIGSLKTPSVSNSEQTSSTITLKVQAGDTLSALAQKYNTSVEQLKAINHLSSDLIIIGQKLTVSTNKTTAPTPTSQNINAQNSIHKVIAGDSLWSLAQTNQTSIQQIKAWNHLSSNLIVVGQYLRVR